MKQKNYAEYVLAAIDSVLIILIVLYFPFLSDKTGSSVEKTSLLNLKYTQLVDTITIQDPLKNTLTLYKYNDTWKGKTEEGMVFPAVISIQDFLDSMSAVRKMQKISDSFESWPSFGLTQDNALSISFENSNTLEKYSVLYFGSVNFNGQKVFVRTEKASVYECMNTMQNYLTADVSFWADTSLIPSCTGITQDTVQSVRLFAYDTSFENTTVRKIITEQSQDFSSYVSRLLHSTGKPVPCNNAEKTAALIIENGDGTEYLLDIFSGVDEQYYAVHTNAEYTYALEISTWTFDRLIEPFLQ